MRPRKDKLHHVLGKHSAKPLPLALAGALGGLVILSLGAPMAMAQTADSGASLQRVEITGSNIRRADKETPSPVQVITAEDLAKSGFTSVSDVLRNITANGQGTLSQSFSQGFAGGASGIALRGLTVGATLVLIDGHRMAPYPLSDDGQRAFVDISNIPFDAVERIEILKDGASATYGSDAIAGVVNVILKKNYVGTKVSAEIGKATEGGGRTTHASVTHGFGDLERDGYNAFGTIEVRQQDRITTSQRTGRGLWQNLDWTSFGGINKTNGIVTPSNPTPITLTPFLTNPNVASSESATSFYPGSCTYALQQAGRCAWQSPVEQIQPRSQNVNILAGFSKALAGDWKLNVKGSYFESKSEQYPAGAVQTFPSSFSPLVAVSAGNLPRIVGSTIDQITVPAGYPGNPFGVPAVVNGLIPGIGPINTQFDSGAVRLVANLAGSYAGWDIDSSVGYTKITTKQTTTGLINIPALNTALNRSSQPFLVTGNNTAADLATIFPTGRAKDTSELDFLELRGTRTIAQLPGGDMGVSVGGTFTHRVLSAPAPDLIARGIVPGNNAFVLGSQNDTAVCACCTFSALRLLAATQAMGAAGVAALAKAGNRAALMPANTMILSTI